MVQAKFKDLLCTYFTRGELRTLCFDLSINYENLPGDTLEDKARELIAFCYRHGQIVPLVNRCRELRSIVLWPDAQALNESLGKTSLNASFQESRSSSALNQTIHGNYNAVSGHGGKATVNVTNIHQTPAEDTIALKERGIRLTRVRAYEQAIDTFNRVLNLTPTDHQAHFYLALSMLKGNRPKLLKLATVRTIEEHLQTATELAPQFGQAYILWALLKYDYYVLNSIRDQPPTVSQLLNRNWSIHKEEVNELKMHFEAPRNPVWEWLQSH